MLVAANIFQPLITVFEAVLKFFHNNVGVGWGLSIVLLTILIRVILLPLTLKQFHSMQSLQRLQPELKAIQNKYKEDKQRQQQELMKFYKENNVNPLASCLPLVAQLPVFISLFYMLRADLRKNICPGVQKTFQANYAAAHHLALAKAAGQTTPCGSGHGAGFLFIHDLTNKATGLTLVVLILLYVGTQLASTVMMQSPTMDATQRRLMMLLPLFFVLFIISFPAGVIVYWVTTNSWTILQQFIVKRRLGPMGPPVPATAGGGDAGGKVGAGRAPAPRAPAVDADTDTNGAGSGGGALSSLGGLLRGKPKEEAAVIARPAGGPPPRPPRKKKKRSGRRR
jgi:YidC/Oxa1 family membrane protein insertase